MYFMVSDYYATGEGRTVSILIDTPDINQSDYEIPPGYVVNAFGDKIWTEGFLKPEYDPKSTLLAKFEKEFGDFFSIGVDFLTEEEFFENYQDFIPDIIKEKLKDRKIFNIFWKNQFHFNYG